MPASIDIVTMAQGRRRETPEFVMDPGFRRGDGHV
jgi:hypothetical protein